MDADAALAMTLQDQEDVAAEAILFAIRDGDRPLDGKGAIPSMDVSDSEPVAIDDELLALREAQLEIDAAMECSISGQAWNFVTTLLKEHKNNLPSSAGCSVLGVDDLMYTVERFLETRDIFQMEGKDTHVDLGYHYTKSQNLDCIQSNGLMTRSDRRTNGVDNNFNGATYGDGVYTGNNFHSFQRYGDVGLIVARLKGDQQTATRGGRGFEGDTAVAFGGWNNEMIILQQSSQCIPLVYFQKSDVHNKSDLLWECHRKLQYMCDQIFHDEVRTHVELPPMFSEPHRAPKRMASILQHPSQSSKRLDSFPPEPSTLAKQGNLSDSAQDLLSVKRNGISPSTTEIVQRSGRLEFRGLYETMSIMTYASKTLSLEGSDGIVIVYAFHPNDCGHTCTHRLAFLPDTLQGWSLLRRLKYAFWTGIIGTATLPLIPHLANPYGTVPQDFYFATNVALDKAGIPKADNCDFFLKKSSATTSSAPSNIAFAGNPQNTTKPCAIATKP